MTGITPHPEGCVLTVRAQPGARRSGVVGAYGGALKLAVAVPPDRGRANQALVELLCALLHRKRAQVELLSGVTSPNKRFLIRGLTAAELLHRIAELLR